MAALSGALRHSALLCLASLAAVSGRVKPHGADFASPRFAAGGARSALALVEEESPRESANSSSGSSKPAYWACKNGDLAHTGASAHRAPWDISTGPAWSWRPSDGGVVRATPVIDGDSNVYLTTINGEVRKMSRTGDLIWSHQEPEQIPSNPALLDGKLYVGAASGIVVALDTETGKVVWRHVPATAQRSGGDTWSVTAAQGVVIVPRRSPTNPEKGPSDLLVGLSAASGFKLWEVPVPNGGVYNYLGAVVDGTLIFADVLGAPYRLSLFTGQTIWQAPPLPNASFTTGGAIVGSNGVIYVTSNVAGTPHITPAEVIQWMKKLNTTAENVIKLAGYNSPEGRLSAYALSEGLLLWSKPLPYPANSGPAVGRTAGPDGPLAVVVGSAKNPTLPLPWLAKEEEPMLIVALDASSGEHIWNVSLPTWRGWAVGDAILPVQHICLPDSFSNTAIGGDGTAYVGAMDGNLYAVRDLDGDGSIDPETEVRSYNAKAAFQGEPAIAPKMLAIAPCDSMHVFLS